MVWAARVQQQKDGTRSRRCDDVLGAHVKEDIFFHEMGLRARCPLHAHGGRPHETTSFFPNFAHHPPTLPSRFVWGRCVSMVFFVFSCAPLAFVLGSGVWVARNQGFCFVCLECSVTRSSGCESHTSHGSGVQAPLTW